MASALKWCFCLIFLYCCCAQRLNYEKLEGVKICTTMFCNDLASLKRLRKCEVILGNLRVLLLERTRKKDFVGLNFTNLREITGYLVVYRVRGLESLGHLFPNLARIRGEQLFDNYALVVHDMPNLRELGLYGLIKIDRGGVIIWGSPTTCFADTIDWRTIAPKTRHVLGPPGKGLTCTTTCTCSRNPSSNYCWNNRKCQRFLTGPDAEECHEQCLGCKKTKSDICSLCRYYTHQGNCVPKCPEDTLLLEANNYCLTLKQCNLLEGWQWNNTCIFKCPLDHEIVVINGTTTCQPCDKCDKICQSQHISRLDGLQTVERCVYINGSLTIHIRVLPEAMDELRKYLARIEEVSDYIYIFDSMTVTSLDFLPSLKSIGGRVLKEGNYSLVVNDMLNMRSLFTPDVTKNLKIGNGTIFAYNNPMLCAEQLLEIQDRFPVKPTVINIPQGKNGYSGNCAAVDVGLTIDVVNVSTVLVTFTPVVRVNVSYSILYVRLTPGKTEFLVPESCSDSEWYAITAPYEDAGDVKVVLENFHPASTYALCIESYDHSTNITILARSAIVNFSTPIGRPARPFITELVSPSSDAIVIRWVNHKDYKYHITHYQLDVTILDIKDEDVISKDQCIDAEEYKREEHDYSLHTVVLRPPLEYNTGCESMCGLLSTATVGAMVGEHFDFCSASGLDCEIPEADPPKNDSAKGFVKSVYFDIVNGSTNEYEVGGLASYRDYRFRLRACIHKTCSMSARRVVRTLAMKDADKVLNVNVQHFENNGLYVKWEAPLSPNGVVLAYLVEVKVFERYSDLSYRLPQVWCAESNSRNIYVNPEKSVGYYVRVCTTTLASVSACGDWVKVSVTHVKNWWWGGAILGVLLCLASTIVALKRKVTVDDGIPLIENFGGLDETDGPIHLLSDDFVPFYTISLQESS